MYILQNAAKNIGRNKGRNILVGFIILSIIATSAVALIINNTAAGIIDNYKERFSSEVSISPNMQKVQEEAQQNAAGGMVRIQRPEISPEQYVAFGESEYLKEAKYSSSVGVNSTDIKPLDEEKGGGGGAMRVMQSAGGVSNASDDGQFYANLFGYNYTPEDFSNGNRQIADGRFPESDSECIISKDLLENSGLKIGDTITLTSSLRDRNAELPLPGEEDTSESAKLEISYTLTIVGYYDDTTDEYTNEYLQNAYTNRRNEIITTIDTVISQMQDGYTGIRVEAKYYLQNPDMLDAFAAEVYAKGLDDKFDVTTDENSYNTIVKPVEGLKSITYVFLIVVLVLGAIILILLSSIAIRERKYEIGVLRAMGMKKNKVAFGLLSEMIMITVVCLVIGLGTGIAAAQPVSDMLLDSQLQQIESENNNSSGFMGGMGGRTMGTNTIRMGGGGFGASPAEALKAMDVSMSAAAILQIILVSLLLAIASSIVGIMHVTKYEPIKILSERV